MDCAEHEPLRQRAGCAAGAAAILVCLQSGWQGQVQERGVRVYVCPQAAAWKGQTRKRCLRWHAVSLGSPSAGAAGAAGARAAAPATRAATSAALAAARAVAAAARAAAALSISHSRGRLHGETAGSREPQIRPQGWVPAAPAVSYCCLGCSSRSGGWLRGCCSRLASWLLGFQPCAACQGRLMAQHPQRSLRTCAALPCPCAAPCCRRWLGCGLRRLRGLVQGSTLQLAALQRRQSEPVKQGDPCLCSDCGGAFVRCPRLCRQGHLLAPRSSRLLSWRLGQHRGSDAGRRGSRKAWQASHRSACGGAACSWPALVSGSCGTASPAASPCCCSCCCCSGSRPSARIVIALSACTGCAS